MLAESIRFHRKPLRKCLLSFEALKILTGQALEQDNLPHQNKSAVDMLIGIETDNWN
jgi:hypothetical protein